MHRSGHRFRHAHGAIGRAVLAAALLGACDSGSEGVAPAPYVVSVDLSGDLGALAAAADDDAGDEREEAADAAARRLRALGVHARPALLEALEREPAPVRVAVAELLGELAATGDGTALARLERLAHDDPDAPVRAAAVAELGDVDAASAATAIEQALGDPDAAVRLAAAGACPGSCRSEAALAALARMAVSDANLGHALAVRRVLARIRADDATAQAAERAARGAGERALAPGAGSSAATSLLAALVLADLGDPRGEPALIAAISGPVRAPALRLQAAYALGRVGGAGAVPALAALLREAGLAPYAADALVRLASRGVGGARAALDAWGGPRPSGLLPPP